MSVPKLLQPYIDEAKGKVTDIEFSGPTYQIQVDEQWAFLQFDHQGHLLDCFCTCDNQDKAGGCVHVAAAYLRIFDRGDQPLHLRFAASFWHAFGVILFDEGAD